MNRLIRFKSGVNCNRPVSHVLVFDQLEARFADHVSKIVLIGKLSNAFHQILIGFPVGGQNLAQHRYHVERVPVVDSKRQEEEIRTSFSNLINKSPFQRGILNL